MRTDRRGGLVTAMMLATLVVACSPSPTVSLVPSAPRPTEPLSESLPPDVQDAVRFRREFGLRSDLDYIAQVASDPTATSDFGVPLLPAEVSDLLRRQATAEAAAPLLDAYGEHPDEFAGWFIDQAAGGVFVVLFTANLEDHRRGLLGALSGRTPLIAVQVKPARHTLAALEALQARIERDLPLWADRGIRIGFVGRSVSLNAVEISVLAPAPTAEQQLGAAYGPDAIAVYVSQEPPQTE